jgi:hypothetical protein
MGLSSQLKRNYGDFLYGGWYFSEPTSGKDTIATTGLGYGLGQTIKWANRRRYLQKSINSAKIKHYIKCNLFNQSRRIIIVIVW